MSAATLIPVDLTPVAPVAAKVSRNGAIDTLRMAAVVGIAFYHAGVLAQLPALAGMHALIVTAVVFASAFKGGVPAGRIVSRRASRLLVPWLFFGLLHLAGAVRSHSVRPWMFLIGGSVHLWFVPFIFVITCGVALACRERKLPRSWGRTIGWTLVTLLMIHTEAVLTPRIAETVPLWQFLDGTTAVAAAMALLSVPSDGRRAPLTLATLLLVLATAVWSPWRTTDMMPLPPAPLGLLLFLGVAMLPQAGNRVTDFLGRTAFGLYLMHPLVLHWVAHIYARTQHVPAENIGDAAIAGCVVVTIFLCIAIIAALERTPAKLIVL